MKHSMGFRFAARAAATSLACMVAAGCSGNALLPASPGAAGAAPPSIVRLSAPEHSKRKVRAHVQIRIPRFRRGHTAHPGSISPLTESVSIVVNGGAPQDFNTTPTSSNCTATVTGRTCSFTVIAPVGTDSFAVTTYSAAGAGGAALDYAVASIPITPGKNNDVSITLGPVVTNTNDGGIGSLRYAVGSASNGDTILFLLGSGSTITLATPIDVFENITIAGPGANALSVSGGNATQLFENFGTLTISGLTLTQGSATGPNPGGDIVTVGSLTLANDILGNSSSTASLKHAARHERARTLLLERGGLHPHCSTTHAYGGAISNAGILVMSGTTFSGDYVPSNFASCIEGAGGAIYNTLNGSISSTGDTFTGNSAYMGGAVYNDSTGPVTFTNDTFSGNVGCTTSSGCPTSGCGTMTCTSFAQGEGAAIYDGGAGVTIASSTFTGNIAGGPSDASTGEGGALYLDGGTPTVASSTFTGNIAGGGPAACSAGVGGAIFATVNVEVDGSTFKDNQATGDSSSSGGAILGVANVTGANDTFTSNQATAAGGACNANATGSGGAVVAVGAGSLVDSTFSSNAASGNGTGAGGAIVANDISLAGDAFASNSAVATGTQSVSSTESEGGAIAVAEAAKITGSSFTSNTVTNDGSPDDLTFGGAIALSGTSPSLTSSGNTFTSNEAIQAAGIGASAGGAIAIVNGTFASTNDAYASNVSTSSASAVAGGVYSAGTSAISGAKFTSNSAKGSTALGGALVMVKQGEVIDDTFTGNAAMASGSLGEGGAIVDVGGSIIVDTTILQNSTGAAGGGIAAATKPETIITSIITDNTVTNGSITDGGGGGLNEGGGVTVQFSTIANNAVTISGPAPEGGGGIFDYGGLSLADSTVSGNTVAGGGGGGIFEDSSADALNATISGNTSSLGGGGIEFAANDADTLDDVTLFQNTAAGNGGNIDNLYTLTLTNSIVGGGSAATGPDIDNSGTIDSGDYNIISTAVAGNALAGLTTHTRTLDPLLLTLSNNGGPTFTNADQATSPGTGFIPFSGGKCGSVAITTDQREYTRGAGGVCDVGAYEFAGVASAIRRVSRGPHRVSGNAGRGLPIPLPSFRPLKALEVLRRS